MSIQAEALAKEFKFLNELGFTLKEVKPTESKLVKGSLRLVYSTKDEFRRISVAYSSGSSRVSRSVTIIIYNDQGKCFALNDFLKVHNLSAAEARFCSSDLASDELDFIKLAASEFEQICNNQLEPILRSAWEDIPFDWKEHK